VLLVDDDPAFLSLAARVVEGMGAKVVGTAPDAAAAVAEADRVRPDAVLVDVGLPDRDGYDLACELAALPWGPRIVLTSADRDALGGVDARDGGCDVPFIPKEELASDSARRLLVAE
jgi:DNA-binding response OmpR family regulator